MLSTSGSTFVEKELDLKCAETNHNICLDEPKRLGYYSFYYNEKENVYCPDKSSLRYLDLPNPVSIDLLQGYDPNTKNGYQQSKNKNLLQWILENETIVRNFDYDFICNNGVLKDIMTYPSYNHDWNLSAVKIRGKIVLNRVASIEKKEKIDAQSEKDNKSTYAAFNLQRLITKNINRSEFPSGIENGSFFGVFHSKIGLHQILHSGYLDCVESEQELNKPFEEMKFVLVKKYNGPKVSHTSLHANTWWSLAKLAGVDTIVRAKCEQDFMVKNIDRFKVDWLINKHRQSIFVASLNMVLDHVKSIVTEENKCYNFYFSGQDKKSTGYVKMDLVSESIIEY
ncbi:decapping and exoribonuclease protein-like [Tetranychus urticae]|uniref:Decapping nuclease n=1 Tax=Tetranychus urticae TaxID=32264 RepID=T1KUD3_TETUR|nr:decapping and exoribonuclease protein-like [Tetranychus urticae]